MSSPKQISGEDNPIQAINELEEQLIQAVGAIEKLQGANTMSLVERWVKGGLGIVAGIFVAGFAFSQARQDVVVVDDFHPLVARVGNLEAASARVGPRLAKLETTLASVTLGLQGLQTELSGFGVKMGLLVETQMANGIAYSRDRYCQRLQGQYLKELSEFTAKIRNSLPEDTAQLNDCRVRPPSGNN